MCASPCKSVKGTRMPEASSGNGKTALRYGDGSELDLPVKSASEGSAGIEVTKLLSTTGMVTLDPGFVNTAACSSEITYIDGDAGILRYRGYPIEQLAERSSFLEVSYLLFYGSLPTAEQLADFTEKVTHHTLLDEVDRLAAERVLQPVPHESRHFLALHDRRPAEVGLVLTSAMV